MVLGMNTQSNIMVMLFISADSCHVWDSWDILWVAHDRENGHHTNVSDAGKREVLSARGGGNQTIYFLLAVYSVAMEYIHVCRHWLFIISDY